MVMQPYKLGELDCLVREQLGDPVEMPIQPFGPNSLCYWNADSFVKKHGGTVVHGWELNIFPKLYIEAMHHAVVRLPDGTLRDVTAPNIAGKTKTVMVVDESIVPPRDYPTFIPKRYIVLHDCEEVQRLIKAGVQQENALRAQMQVLKAQGHKFPFAADMRPEYTNNLVNTSIAYEKSRAAVGQAWDDCARVQRKLS